MLEKVNKYLGLQNSKENLKKLFLLYLLVLCFTHGEFHIYIKVFLGTICIIGILIPEISSKLILWISIGLALIYNLYFSYSYSSNHYFLATYTVLAIIIDLVKSRTSSQLHVNPYRTLLIITFGLATLQKIINPYFLSGRLMASYILGGGSFYQALSLVNPNHEKLVYSYYDTATLAKAEPFINEVAGLPITMPGENFVIICIALSVLIIVAELLMFFLTAIPKYFYHRKFAWAVLPFVWLTFTFRQEYSFFALLLILFLLSVDMIKRIPNVALKSSIFLLLFLDLTNKYL
jgi:hypothetical protein